MLMNVCPHLVTAHQWSKKDAANWRHIKARSNPDPQNVCTANSYHDGTVNQSINQLGEVIQRFTLACLNVLDINMFLLL